MSLQSSRWKYGSLGESGHTSHDRASFDFDPSRTLRGKDEQDEEGGKRRWFTLVLVGVVAVGVMVALTLAGYRSPKVTRTSGDSHSPENVVSASLIQLDDLSRPRLAETQAVQQLPQPSPKQDQQYSDELSPLSFTALNFYHERDGKPAQDYPWLKEVKLIEPYRDTTLAVSSPREGYDYHWVVRGGSEDKDDLRAEASGSEAVVVLTVPDENFITLEEMNSKTGEVARRLQERVMVKYVRREIRTLTDDEREELFDAMYTMWTVRVDGGNGKELYGDDYTDIFAINRLHFKGAGAKECDHFHDGLGFLTSHAMVSNTFEASLQTVNPKLTLPYWDFTIEASSTGGAALSSTDQPLTKSELFQDSWFGTVDPTDDQVKDGRWAYTEIPLMKLNNPGGVEPDVYSKLRAPWNVNDRPYLTRGMGKMCGANIESFPWPTCDMHYSLVTEYSDFYSWVWYSLYDPHGPVHIWIGGVLDCERTYEHIASLIGPENAEELALYSFVHHKNLFREGLFSCTGTASVEESPADVLASGQCGCLGYDLTQGDDYEEIMGRMVGVSSILSDFDADVKRQVVAALCSTPANDGDQLQASSSMDPSFYSTHPTMERLWMFTVLTGQIADFTWPDSDTIITKPDGSTVSESISIYGDTCEGHRGSDVFPFGLLDNDMDDSEIKTGIKGMESGNTLTNRELLEVFDPRINSLSYVYDTFKWTHCEADGFDFDDAWSSKATTSKERRSLFKDGVRRAPMYKVFNTKRAEREAKKHVKAF